MLTNEAYSLLESFFTLKKEYPLPTESPDFGLCWFRNEGSVLPDTKKAWIDYFAATDKELGFSNDSDKIKGTATSYGILPKESTAVERGESFSSR